MGDVVWGDVINIVDGDTFDLHVTHISRNNQNTYNDKERIRIANVDAPELPSGSGRRAKDQLERALMGKYVRCDIQSRDTFGRLVCNVSIAQKPTT